MTERDSHMHSVRLAIADPDHLRGVWASAKDGQITWEADSGLMRRK